MSDTKCNLYTIDVHFIVMAGITQLNKVFVFFLYLVAKHT